MSDQPPSQPSVPTCNGEAKYVPFAENHELHGLLIWGGTAVAIRGATGMELSSSLAVGGFIAYLATSLMKVYGHPKFFSM
jgi:hypothetical protein